MFLMHPQVPSVLPDIVRLYDFPLRVSLGAENRRHENYTKVRFQHRRREPPLKVDFTFYVILILCEARNIISMTTSINRPVARRVFRKHLVSITVFRNRLVAERRKTAFFLS